MDTIVVTNGDMRRPAELIRGGALVAVPTETVYGLAANGLDSAAVSAIYEVKGRPGTKPISLLVSGMEDVRSVASDIPESAFVLAEHFWPGPLTMVLHKADCVPDIVTAGGGTIGVRCPNHAHTLDLIRRCGVPLAAPSANMSGGESPKTAQEVLDVFGGRIACVVDGGRCEIGVESTILDMTVTPPRILRQGGLPEADIMRVLGTL